MNRAERKISMHSPRYGLRTLLQKPGFTLVAVVMLSLGIGANTAIFSVIDAVLLRPLPFWEPERLVAVWSRDLRNPQSKLPVSGADLADWRARSRAVERFGGWFTMDLTMTGRGEAVRVKAKGAQEDLLGVPGVAPLHGRVFRAGDHFAAVLSHRFWRQRFNSDPNAVGQGITLGDQHYTVVGVMPAGFQFPIEAEGADVWLTWDYAKLPPGPTARRDARLAEAVGRLRPGATIEQAQAELDTIAAALRAQYPDTNNDIGVRLAPLEKNLTAEHRRGLWILFGAVGCVLLIACANVANLLLVRAAGRSREFAVRAALGASPGQLMRQLLAENLLLALAGGVSGCLVALWSVEALLALSPADLPGAEQIGVNGRVLAFTLLLTMLTSVLFGLAPAWRASRVDLVSGLRDGARTASESRGGRRLRDALVVAEIALSLVLLAGAALLLHSFWRLRQADPGFDPRNVLTFRVSLSYETYDATKAGEFFRRLQARLQTIPGVRAAANIFPLPLNDDREFDDLGVTLDARFAIEGQPVAQNERPHYDPRTAQHGYFRAMGIRLLDGRDFDVRDDAAAPPVAIINDAMARRHFAGRTPIGQRIRLTSLVTPNEPPMRRIVGVAADVRHRGVRAEPRPEIYVPFAQAPFQEMFVVVKTDGDPTALTRAVRAAVSELDPAQPIFNVTPMTQRLSHSVAGPRFNLLLLAIFAGLALLLAAVGLYGVLSYAVAARTHELGIRLALGAQSRDVLRLVFGQGLKLISIGLPIGLAGAFALTRLLGALVYGVSPRDPLTFLAAALLLATVAMIACYLPARRATKVDPMIALRSE
jgi:putative ABC transport system permease protein